MTDAVMFSCSSVEWLTPRVVIDAVLRLWPGGVDLDPCAETRVHPNVPAASYYTKEDDGLAELSPWHGRVYMNPPYGGHTREIDKWVKKLVLSHTEGAVSEAVALLPARTETRWFRALREYPVCFVAGRLSFGNTKDPAPFPSAIVYLGSRSRPFYRAFSPLGDVYRRWAGGSDE